MLNFGRRDQRRMSTDTVSARFATIANALRMEEPPGFGSALTVAGTADLAGDGPILGAWTRNAVPTFTRSA